MRGDRGGLEVGGMRGWGGLPALPGCELCSVVPGLARGWFWVNFLFVSWVEFLVLFFFFFFKAELIALSTAAPPCFISQSLL